jgi:hypothetical protein
MATKFRDTKFCCHFVNNLVFTLFLGAAVGRFPQRNLHLRLYGPLHWILRGCRIRLHGKISSTVRQRSIGFYADAEFNCMVRYLRVYGPLHWILRGCRIQLPGKISWTVRQCSIGFYADVEFDCMVRYLGLYGSAPLDSTRMHNSTAW